jgi:hypothetical protein
MLETALHTPFISGELETWVTTLQRAVDTVEPTLNHELETVHREQFAVIGRESDHLATRVPDLVAADKGIREGFDRFKARIKDLEPRAEKVGPDEGRVNHHLTELIQQGIALVNEIRRQDVAVRTWWVEAMNRDTGTID